MKRMGNIQRCLSGLKFRVCIREKNQPFQKAKSWTGSVPHYLLWATSSSKYSPPTDGHHQDITCPWDYWWRNCNRSFVSRFWSAPWLWTFHSRRCPVQYRKPNIQSNNRLGPSLFDPPTGEFAPCLNQDSIMRNWSQHWWLKPMATEFPARGMSLSFYSVQDL